MARVTVEDCIKKIPNRFELVLLSTKRARDLSYGAKLTVARDGDRNSVIALREIAESSINLDNLLDSLLEQLKKPVMLSDAIESEFATTGDIFKRHSNFENDFENDFGDEAIKVKPLEDKEKIENAKQLDSKIDGEIDGEKTEKWDVRDDYLEKEDIDVEIDEDAELDYDLVSEEIEY